MAGKGGVLESPPPCPEALENARLCSVVREVSLAAETASSTGLQGGAGKGSPARFMADIRAGRRR